MGYLIYQLIIPQGGQKMSDVTRLESLKRDKADNEKALATAIFDSHAKALQRAIDSQERAIARLEREA